MKLLIRWIISALALFAAAYFVPGIRVEGANAWTVYAFMAVILGLVNALRPPGSKTALVPFHHPDLGPVPAADQRRFLPDRGEDRRSYESRFLCG